MNLLQLKTKLEKGKILGGEVIYIKEENILYGINSVYKDQENKNIVILKSNEETVKTQDFIELLNDIYTNIGDGEVFIKSTNLDRSDNNINIKSVEFAQYELTKMLFINV